MQYVARSTNAAAALPIKRAHVEDLSSFPFPKEGPIANTETVFDRISVEIARGCTEGCRFCQAGMIYRPVREREPQEVVDVIDHAITHGGYDGASLTCLSTADYSAISPLIHTISGQLKKKHATLSVASLRAYGLDEDVLDKLRDTGSKGLTFAPEAGTQRMRDVVNKNVTEEQLLETAKRVFERGWSRMKLYFMIGLPTEEDDDVRGIAQTGDRAYAIGRRLVGRTARITVNVSTHVPKPHTPFQWCAMDSRRDVLRKQALLREEAGSSGITLRMHASAGSWVEGVLSRGDRSLCDAIEAAYRRGARFDSWDEALKIEAWDEAFKEVGIDVERFLGTIPVTAHLPWEHLDVGLEDKFLVREYRRALRNRLSPPCGKALGTFVHQTNLEGHDADTRKLICYNCGVACDMTHMRDRRGELLVQLGALTPRPVEAPAELPAKHRGRRRPPARADQGEALRVRVRFEKLGRGAYGSHLDLVRLVPRLLRRLELPIYYSKGFKQKPVMAFGPALPLGMFSLSEYIDLKLVASTPIDYATLPEQLSITSIEGVRFIEALPLGPGDPKLNRVIDEAVYVVGLPRTTLDAIGVKDEVELAALIEERQTGELVVRREIEGVVKQVDVGHYLRGVSVGEGHAVLERAGLIGELIPVTLRLAITATGSARATEALDVLLGVTDQPARIVRSELLFTRGNVALRPLQLDEIRESLANGREMDVAR
jgi:radical SAM-linked protein